MSTKDINLASIDNDDLKTSLVNFLKSTEKFKDFDYEGSTLSTLIDMLVYNTTYYTFFANMVSNESSLQHAQKRNNVVGHAELLGYVPRSMTSSRMLVDIKVKGYTTANTVNDSMITLDKGKQFICSYDDVSYTFTNINTYNAYYDSSSNSYTFKDVVLYQGTLVTSEVTYQGDPIVLSNANTDTDTISLYEVITQKPYKRNYTLNTDISDIEYDSNAFYIKERNDLTYELSFGNNVIGREPASNSTLNISYVICDDNIGNGVSSIVAATLISGLGDIDVTVKTPAWGGSVRETTEEIRSIAPHYHEAQKRAVTSDDYAVLVKNKYPVISDVSVWGGENANPPAYGIVYISVVMTGNPLGYIGVKDDIVTYLKDKRVGVVTPVVIEPDMFTIDLDLLVESTKNNLEEIKHTINEYGKTLGLFNQSFNQSAMSYQIMGIDGVSAIDDVEKTIRTSHVSVSQGFWYNYYNAIKKGTYVVTDKNRTVATDDGNGNIINTTGEVIGTIDYANGGINLSKWELTASPSVSFKLSGKHFYSMNNMICSLGAVNITIK